MPRLVVEAKKPTKVERPPTREASNAALTNCSPWKHSRPEQKYCSNCRPWSFSTCARRANRIHDLHKRCLFSFE